MARPTRTAGRRSARPIPKGADVGQGSATVLVTTEELRARPRTTRSSRSSSNVAGHRSRTRRPVDSRTHSQYHRAMPMWRCPHCGTPQAETARCWVCRRSCTACGTCRHFRRSVAAQLGYCGLDRQRQPLRGDEIRACWEALDRPDEVEPAGPGRPVRPPYHPVDDGTLCSAARVRRGRRRAVKAAAEARRCSADRGRARGRAVATGRASCAGQPGRAALEPVGRRRGLTAADAGRTSTADPRGPAAASRA